MIKRKYTVFKVLLLLPAIWAMIFAGCNEKKEALTSEGDNIELPRLKTDTVVNSDTINNDLVAIEAPPFTEGIYPCNDCHSYMDPNPQRRKLVDMHDDISSIFDHDSANRWCLDCHDMNNRNYLRLASGKLIGFDESYKLCGQCHGDKLRDWKVGVHGKRTGMWNGKKQYLLCVHCHSPHSPRFKPLKPMPPPVRQEDIQRFQ